MSKVKDVIFSLSALKVAALSIPMSSRQILTRNFGAQRQLGTVLQLMITQARGSDCAPSMKENSGILSFEVLHMLGGAILIFFLTASSEPCCKHKCFANLSKFYLGEKERNSKDGERREGRQKEREIETDKLRDIESDTAYILPWPCATASLPLSLSPSRGLWEERLAFINKTIWRKNNNVWTCNC